MRKFHLIFMLVLFPILLFAQTEEEKKIIKDALYEMGKEVSSKYFEENGDLEALTPHLGSLERIKKRMESYYSDPNDDLRWTIHQVWYCSTSKGINNINKNNVKDYLVYVRDTYVKSKFKQGEYSSLDKINDIINEATKKANELSKIKQTKTSTAKVKKPIASSSTEADNESTATTEVITPKDYTPNDGDNISNLITPTASSPDTSTTKKEKVTQSKKDKITIDDTSTEPDVEDNKRNGGSSPFLWFLGGILSCAALLVVYKWFKNRQNMEDNEKDPSKKSVSELETEQTESEDVTNKKDETPTPVIPPNNTDDQWIVVGGSVIGNSHIKMEIPCQDNHHYQELEYGWYLAVVADGAGSAKRSERGSELVAKKGVPGAFGNNIKDLGWYKKGEFPGEEEWKAIAQKSFKEIYAVLKEAASKSSDASVKDLACTTIVALIRPNGVLVTHIGDGRAGYKNDKEEWKPMLTPYRGEEANATIFITSDIWSDDKIDEYIKAHVIKEPVTAFTLLSDGCESAAFECSIVDPETGKWSDLNRPYPKFFNALSQNLIGMKKSNISAIEMKSKWEGFLKEGNQKLKNEADDKTMILGIITPLDLKTGKSTKAE